MKERVFGARTAKEPSIGGPRIKETKESEALDEFAYKGVHGDHTFGFELAERHVNRPLSGPCRTKAVVGQIGAFQCACRCGELRESHCHRDRYGGEIPA